LRWNSTKLEPSGPSSDIALRRRRNRTEYPDLEAPGVNEDDARQALDTAHSVVDAAKRLLDSARLGASE
jgi:HEPN domain-containing protein